MRHTQRRVGRWRTWARNMWRQLVLLQRAVSSPRVPRSAKIIAGAVLIYAASPIDLIPDFIPVVGYLDDLILVPIGAWLAFRLIAPEVLDQLRSVSANPSGETRVQRLIGALLVGAFWICALLAFGALLWLGVRNFR